MRTSPVIPTELIATTIMEVLEAVLAQSSR